MPSPLDIEILMHYAVCGVDFPRLDAPAVKDAVAQFLRDGLLEHAAPDRRYAPQYAATEGARVYLQALTAVPFPVQRWVVPEAVSSAHVGQGWRYDAECGCERCDTVGRQLGERI